MKLERKRTNGLINRTRPWGIINTRSNRKKGNMTPEELINLVNNTQFYSYKDKDYKVIKIVKIKSVVTNVWFDGVEYVPLYEIHLNEWQGSFVRPLSDFINLFSPTINNTLHN